MESGDAKYGTVSVQLGYTNAVLTARDAQALCNVVAALPKLCKAGDGCNDTGMHAACTVCLLSK